MFIRSANTPGSLRTTSSLANFFKQKVNGEFTDERRRRKSISTFHRQTSLKFSGSYAQHTKRSSWHKKKRALWDALRRERNPISTMKSYHRKRLKKSVKQLIHDIVIASIGGVAIVSMIIGASIQHQDRINEIAAAEVQE